MLTLTLADVNWVPALLVVAFLFVAVLMILIVLIQKPQGGGLSGAFGASSAGSGQTAFGARTGDALTIATILIFCVFLLVSIGLNFALRANRAPVVPEMSAAPGAMVDDEAERRVEDRQIRVETAPSETRPDTNDVDDADESDETP